MASRRVEADFRARCCFETKRELRDRLQKVEQRESSYTDSIVALLSSNVPGLYQPPTPNGDCGPRGV